MYIRNICIFTKTHPEYFKKVAEVSRRVPRKQYINMLHKPPCLTDIYKKNVYNMCIMIYNNVPDEIKMLPERQFKAKLTEWLLLYCFYNVNEFINFKVMIHTIK